MRQLEGSHTSQIQHYRSPDKFENSKYRLIFIDQMLLLD